MDSTAAAPMMVTTPVAPAPPPPSPSPSPQISDLTAELVTTPRSERGVSARDRLEPEHAMQRQRAQDEPILVAWKVERRSNRQELISISSSDDDASGSDGADGNSASDGAIADVSGSNGHAAETDEHESEQEEAGDDEEYEYKYDEHDDHGDEAEHAQYAGGEREEREDQEAPSATSSADAQRRKRNNSVIDVDEGVEHEGGNRASAQVAKPLQQRSQVIYPIDSEDDDNSDCDSDGGCEIVEARAGARGDQAFKQYSAEIADGNTTPETTDSSCGDIDSRIKNEAEQQTLAVETEPLSAPSAFAAQSLGVPPSSAAAGEPAMKPKPSVETRVIPRKAIPLMRRKKLDEEDAAFLLFYGISEAPSARILSLIIEYIDRCAGESSAFVSRYTKFLLWCKMNAHVNAGIDAERLARSEWMKIVFSSDDPSMRPEIYRSQLLPRPVRITVRPLQLVRKRVSGGGAIGYAIGSQDQSKADSRKHDVLSPGKESKARVKDEQSRSGAAANGVASRAGNTGVYHPSTVPASLHVPKHRKQPPPPPSASSKKRKAEKIAISSSSLSIPDSPLAQSPLSAIPYTPRKHRRRNGSNTLYEAELPVRSRAKSSGLPKSSEILRPLAPNQVTAGSNRSLPIGRGFGDGLYIRTGPCMPVCPLQSMSVAELESHITSVRSEGRIKGFEKLSDIIAKLMADSRNYRGLFNSPVDPVALNLPTYATIVTRPMDLGTVRRRLAEGKYIEKQDFASDVRLVFENAMLFNAPGHSVHLCAKALLQLFESELKSLNRLQKRNHAPKHACSACYGHTCALCEQQCLPFVQPHLQCAGGCGADIRKGSIYFMARDGTRVWCNKCRSRLAREKAVAAGGKDASALMIGSQSFSQSSQSVGDSTDENDDAVVTMRCETSVEPWVKCSECDRWMHQVCGLFNPVQGAYAGEHEFVCPLCCWRRKSAAPPASSSLHNLMNSAFSSSEETKSTCLNIPPCELSIFIQSFLRHELEVLGEGEAAASLNVRVLSFPGEKMAIPEGVVRAFDENANALAQVLPERDVSSQRLPAEVTYLSRGIYLFQKHDGVDVSLFTLYAQEFGEDCELPANRRAVYIAYIDSIRYLKPAKARTSAYHLIMLAYFDYIRRHGFDRVHIWSCPPQKRISYVFWCRPAFQKTPSAEHLRNWYSALLEKAKHRDIVRDWTTLFDRYLSHTDTEMPVKGEDQHLIATRGVTSRSVDPADLVWPVTELPPIFDGDFVPTELDRILGTIAQQNGKKRRSSEPAKNASIGNSGGKRAMGNAIARFKDDPEDPGASQQQQQPPQNVEYKLREIFSKCQSSVKRMNKDLLVVNLVPAASSDSAAAVAACRPDTTVPKWCRRVPRFFGSRFMFHQLCASSGYQFDSLRRAKHSTMMILHHYFNEHVTQVNVFCRECSLLITHAEYWSCQQCDRFALCDACFQRHGHAHDHLLQYGRQVSVWHTPQQPQQLRQSQEEQHVQHDAGRRLDGVDGVGAAPM